MVLRIREGNWRGQVLDSEVSGGCGLIGSYSVYGRTWGIAQHGR